MNRYYECEKNAEYAAKKISNKLGLVDPVKIGIILGSGWGDALDLKDAREMTFKETGEFSSLGDLAGHRRIISAGTLADKSVIMLKGRVHLYESHHPDHWQQVRLQVEMLLRLGVKRLVLTCATGALPPDYPNGTLVLIKGFLSLFGPTVLVGGEFLSPEKAIDQEMVAKLDRELEDRGFPLRSGIHAMVRGPRYESETDKKALAMLGANVVGMSVLPEAEVVSLYAGNPDPADDPKIIPVAFISNSSTEEHNHSVIVDRAKSKAAMLGSFLTEIVSRLDV